MCLSDLIPRILIPQSRPVIPKLRIWFDSGITIWNRNCLLQFQLDRVPGGCDFAHEQAACQQAAVLRPASETLVGRSLPGHGRRRRRRQRRTGGRPSAARARRTLERGHVIPGRWRTPPAPSARPRRGVCRRPRRTHPPTGHRRASSHSQESRCPARLHIHGGKAVPDSNA